MKTTINIDDAVMQHLLGDAERCGSNMSTLVDAGLRRVIFDTNVLGNLKPTEVYCSPTFMVHL